MQTDGQGGMAKLQVALRTCVNAPTKYNHYKQIYVQKK